MGDKLRFLQSFVSGCLTHTRLPNVEWRPAPQLTLILTVSTCFTVGQEAHLHDLHWPLKDERKACGAPGHFDH